MVVLIDRSLCQTRDGLVFKSTKTEEPRKVELPPSTVACLDAHRLRQDEFRRQFGPDYRSDLDLIFANPDGSPLMPNSISSTVSRLCRRLGLPKGASLHVLRHSHASLLLADGVDLATVSDASATHPFAQPPTSTATRSAARTTPRPGVGTISCSERAARNPLA